ncbi:MAG: uracil-DNA glycosylase [Lachnospiraceae bacterium]|nr:uracil-DNA glycosylase [Lachnospiraceae bacterium]
MAALSGAWAEALGGEFKKEYYRRLYETVRKEYNERLIYPPSDRVFAAMQLTPLEKVRVVILGQDPYHEPGQAQGLCFSVPEGVKIPPSLVNIYQELHDDLGCDIPQHGNLTHWAEQGVLLLNTILTVRAHAAFSHKGIGWEQFTDAIIEVLDKVDRPIVFLLWGSPAQKKSEMLHNPAHLILKAPHPSPLSAYRGFFGCRHFSRCNAFLEEHGEAAIDWQIR